MVYSIFVTMGPFANCLINHIAIGGNVVECVNTCKILGLLMDKDLKWNSHAQHISKKACKKLYSLKALHRAGVCKGNILKIYLSMVRPMLEYAAPVWQAIPAYLSGGIVQVRKKGTLHNLP